MEPSNYHYYESQKLLFKEAIFNEPHTIIDDANRKVDHSLHMLVPINPKYMSIAIYQSMEKNISGLDENGIKLFKGMFKSDEEIVSFLKGHVERAAGSAAQFKLFETISSDPFFVIRWRLYNCTEPARVNIFFVLEVFYDYLTPSMHSKLCRSFGYTVLMISRIIPVEDDEVQIIINSAVKKNISVADFLREQENKPPIKRQKFVERPSGVSDISSFFKKI